jgi:hypothetical protein
MSLICPTSAKTKNLQEILNRNLTLKIYGNNHTPAVGDTIGSYTEISGGGYVAKTLTYANWVIASAIATYNTFQNFNFTGVLSGAGTTYGYYIVDSDGDLRWAERWDESVAGFAPVIGSLIRIKPKIQA